MITITKQNDGVLFTFQDSDKYLYGNGSILVPFNTLSIVADESDMITLKKAASNDVFISARYDTDLGYRSKDDAIDDLKGMLFAETGGGSESGITSGDVQTMIDESLDDYYDKDEVDSGFSTVNTAIAGKADTSDVTAVANDVQTVSGQVATKVAITDFNAYSAATDARIAEDEEVTAAALNDLQENKADTSAVTAVQQSLSGKQDTLVLYTEETVEDYETGSYNKTGKIEATSENGNYVADVYATLEYDGDIGESIPFATMDANTGDGLGNSTMTSVYVDGASATLYAQEDTDDGEGNTGFTSANISVNTMEIDMNVNDGTDEMQVRIDTTGVTINGDAIATEPYVDAAISGKADTSAVTAEISAATSGKVDTSAITTSITSGSTDSEIPSAKATYEAIQAGGGGGMDDDTQQLISTALNDLNDRKADLTKLSKYQRKGDYVETSTLSDYVTNDAFDEYVTAKERIISGSLNDLNDKFGGLKLVKISQTDYDNLATKDGNTLYIINNVI